MAPIVQKRVRWHSAPNSTARPNAAPSTWLVRAGKEDSSMAASAAKVSSSRILHSPRRALALADTVIFLPHPHAAAMTAAPEEDRVFESAAELFGVLATPIRLK